MRLDKLLEGAKVGSRSQVKKLIKAQEVWVDHMAVRNGRQNVDPGLQLIEVAGQRVTHPKHSYIILNKPEGVISAKKDTKQLTVIDQLAEKDRNPGLYPVGRLDKDTEGLVLLTDNGPLGFRMLHPSHHVSKTYLVTVNGLLAADAPDFFAAGICFPTGEKCQPAQLTILKADTDQSQASLTISEGKFHQVKKMFLTYGLKVTSLKRTHFAGLELGHLASGEYRYLTESEKRLIKTYLD
ncbi:UNVERIFIED_CONTAM: rRNA pseudouridine synthase [Streptococcus canis]|uniref:Pseudouridine synthase n=1 Tax=Streptococcus canis FSL Z3-227 TaxID=482234 RepID=A0AAV3FSZ0_STRCB|nr:pseudouridine synthase [Streptococcus canis]EIQ82245.1 putative 16S pseudouridylate synthetase [Streptococcus canis FSL Z3-227]MDV5988137.1 rRNA pseudouridine synthase [Streptococcus canis]MDV5992967.1 rRNA pseudouridine synthase [Streptococcus canis]MDV6001096.1 rRNA pseudouridine synthase [Streptococcus canis]MDV6022307.1 rRNA pseudouridine synthase [Streptococcus canis]